MNKVKIDTLKKDLLNKSPEEILLYCSNKFGEKITFASSLGAEDQVLTEMISKIGAAIKIFTLDTGRLFPETYDLIDRTCNKYKVNFKIFFPDWKEVENMVNTKGINLFYHSIDNRKECCNIRKIKPLHRALSNKDAWISGLRKDQAVTRSEIEVAEWDDNNKLIKINPLYNWTEKMVWDYIKKYNIPYNTLHDKNFPSIGCQPCTRAILDDEDVRAGRWWWENPDTKECGLHKK